MERVSKWLDERGLDRNAYQIDGIEWCLKREIEGSPVDDERTVRGGLLADEMGLGKTITMLAMLIANPLKNTLIVLPKALIDQWERAITTLIGEAPFIYHGANIQRMNPTKFAGILNINSIIITTYGMLANNGGGNLLHTVDWSRVIYDEAHHLRNQKTKIFGGAHRLAKRSEINWLVTGTPIQNRKSDFYSLCDIMRIPARFYQNPDNLRMLVNLFIIKRTKQQVGITMTELKSTTVTVEWTDDCERKLSEKIHSKLSFSGVDGDGVVGGVGGFDIGDTNYQLPFLIKARQSCIMPNLVKNIRMNSDEGDRPISSKLEAVIEVIVASGKDKKKLVFCHYRGEIDEIEARLRRNDFRVKVYDGRCKSAVERVSILTDATDCDVLILQIQTGCEGLNLQVFSQVYFISPHWNPAIEQQAVARCHRIGQKRDVDVFRFIMAPFVEGEGAGEGAGNKTCNIEMYSNEVQERKKQIALEISRV